MGETATIKPAASDPNAFRERVGQYSVAPNTTLADFVDTLLQKNPQVIYFGEIHKEEPENYKSTLEHFKEKILPRLAQRGFCDLVLEFIPDDPVIEQELALFYETGQLDESTAPELLYTIPAYDRCAIIDTLQTARQLGVRVHGAYLSLAEIPATVENDQYQTNQALQEQTAQLIAGHILRQAQKLGAQNRKFLVYGGLAHNDTQAGGLDSINVGEYLNQRYGKRYVEVDLIVPEALADVPPEYRSYVVPANWQKLIPHRGITVLKHANSYYLLFRRSCQVTQLDFSAFFSCPLITAPLCGN